MVELTLNIFKIYELDKQIFENEAYIYNQYETMLKTNNYLFYLIKNNNNNNIGFVILLKCSEGEYELIKIGIIHECRIKGYALNALNQILVNLNYKNIFLEVNVNNIKAINLYKKLGFKTINIRKKYYDDKFDALIMSKEFK